MTIQAILKNKGAEVVAIDAAHQVAEAVRIMDKRQIGALVVTGQGEDCSGIFTERDVMRALARNGTHILEDAVGKHMTDRPQSILPTTSVEEAMEIMTERRFRPQAGPAMSIMANGKTANNSHFNSVTCKLRHLAAC